jgi:hypothetical protein
VNTVQIIAVVSGALVIVLTIWQIVKNGIAKSNGRIPEADGNWLDGGAP